MPVDKGTRPLKDFAKESIFIDSVLITSSLKSADVRLTTRYKSLDSL